MEIYDYDVIVIGSGSAGLSATTKLASANKKVAIVEKDQYLGGECPNYACIPTKTLLGSAKYYRGLIHAEKFGLSVDDSEFNYALVKAYKDEIVRRTGGRNTTRESLKKQNIDLIRGEAKFIDKHSIDVSGQAYSAKNFIIATGSRVNIPKIQGIEKVPYLTSKTAQDLDELPESIIIVGAGPVGLEFAQILISFGVDVTVVGHDNKILGREDQEIAMIVKESLEDQGVKFLLNFKAEQIDGDVQSIVLYGLHNKKEATLRAGKILMATGKVPNIDKLNLGVIGLELSPTGIKSNDYLESSLPHIFVAGDVSGHMLYTSIAHYEGIVVASNIINTDKIKIDFRVAPRGVFVHPEVASVGENEEDLLKSNKNIVVGKSRIDILGRALADGEQYGLVKIVCSADTGEILGASIASPRAGEMIHEIALAMQANIHIPEIAQMLHVFPTYSEAIALAASDATSKLKY